MLGGVVILQLSLIASALVSTGLRFSEDPAFAVFKGWKARTTGNLTFHFKTESENGFLVYQDDHGQCQYIYLSLADGRLRLRLKMGECDQTQTLHVGHKLNDAKWHKVTVQRDFKVTRLTVDNLTNSTIYNGRRRQILVIKSDLLVGGIPWSTPLNDLSFPPIFYESNHYGFNGCISGIKHSIEGRPLKEARLRQTKGTSRGCLDPCSKTEKCKNGGICRYNFIEAHCDCKGTRFEGTNCTEETASIWLNGSGFVVFHVKQEPEDFDSNDNYIAFHLKTSHYHGIIFTLQSHRYYLMIEMMHGKLRVELDLGEGQLVLSGRHHVNDDIWHHVEFTRRFDTVTLMIDHHVNATGRVSVKPFKPNVVYVAGGPRNVFRKSESKRNFSGYLQEFYFGKMKILDSIVPTITDRRFSKVGTVIDGSLISEGSGGSGCLSDDEDDECRDTTTDTPVVITQDDLVTSTATQFATELVPRPVPTGVQAQRSLPQVVPFWVISVLVGVAAIAILVTLFFLYRWNSRYSGSFKPESTSSSCGNSPKHGSYVVNPRIRVTVHDEKI